MGFLQISDVLVGPMDDCESPIEKMLWRGFVDFALCGGRGFRDALYLGRKQPPPYDTPTQGVFIWPQAELVYFRVDFLLVGRYGQGGRLESGKPAEKSDHLVKLIVECDGHEFHDNKERAAADRQRDRALTADGYRVLRFTGSEIHAAPWACANEAMQVLAKLQIQ